MSAPARRAAACAARSNASTGASSATALRCGQSRAVRLTSRVAKTSIPVSRGSGRLSGCASWAVAKLVEPLPLRAARKRRPPNRTTAVIPYYGYARQDRKVAPRVPISAKLVADLITTAGASRVLTVDLHAGQIQGFFNVPVDNVYATPVLLEYLRGRIGRRDVTVISPDAGGVERARAFAKRLDANLAIIDKRRARPNEVAEMQIIGEVDGRVAVIVDDMVDTAGTLAAAAEAGRGAGAPPRLARAAPPGLPRHPLPPPPPSDNRQLIVP